MSLAAEILLWHTLSSLHALDPTVAEDVELTPSETTYVSADWAETSIRARPWIPSQRVATLSRGTRLVVRGEALSPDDKGCHGEKWFWVLPFGFVCSEQVTATKTPPETGGALPLRPGDRLPHDIAYVREDGVPMFANLQALEDGLMARTLTKGMSLVVSRNLEVDGETYVQTKAGQLVPKWAVRWGGQGSMWNGVVIEGEHLGPSFAWVTNQKAPVYDTPRTADHKRIDKLARRERVTLYEHFDPNPGRLRRDDRWYRISPDGPEDGARWVSAKDLNEVVFIDPPTEIRSVGEQWIDVDLGEQVLVAYRGDRPVYATLVSSGRSHRTPMGNYPVWAKVASMTMANQEYEDKPYMVQGVPWVLLFQGHNAIHGAYWHDRFGVSKSHGCVNLSPLDARWVFEWAGPVLERGWTGYLPHELDQSVLVHVRDSSKAPGFQFTQERPIGPPDREAEARKAEEARARREREALATGSVGLPQGVPPDAGRDALGEPAPQAPQLQAPSVVEIQGNSAARDDLHDPD